MYISEIIEHFPSELLFALTNKKNRHSFHPQFNTLTNRHSSLKLSHSLYMCISAHSVTAGEVLEAYFHKALLWVAQMQNEHKIIAKLKSKSIKRKQSPT